MSIPIECQAIQDQISSLQAEIAALQEELTHASPEEKRGLLQQIRAVSRQLARLDAEMTVCVEHAPPPPPPPPPPLDLVFTGNATVTTTFRGGEGPHTKSLRLKFLLNGERSVITMTSHLSVTTDVFDTPLGLNQTTVSRTGGGLGSYADGHIAMPLTLRFDQSVDIPFYEEDSTLALTLRTDAPGSPLRPGPYGHVKLVGSGVFQEGVLSGATGTVLIDGVLAAPMSTTVPDVRELRRTAAVTLVRGAGLVPRLLGAVQSPQAWVYSQSPKAETVAFRGDTVTLNLRSEPIP